MIMKHIRDLVKRLPATKLKSAYNLLVDLVKQEVDEQSHRQKFMRLPLSERRRIMAQQAEQMVAHYKQTLHEREMWQVGEFIYQKGTLQ